MVTPIPDLIPTLTYRRAEERDLEWINEQYEQLGFQASHFPGEIIWMAESRGRPVAVGRLIDHEDDTCELGGMFVLEAFRHFGIGKRIVELLLKDARANFEKIFCIPLNHLRDFYMSFGFEDYSGDARDLPRVLQEKQAFCEKSLQTKHLLVLSCLDEGI